MADTIQVLYAAEPSAASAEMQTVEPTSDGLERALAVCTQGALLAIGGTAFSPPLPWREWVRELPRFRPGLGEVVRQRLLASGHPGAALVAVEGAVEAGRIVIVAPDDAAVRDAALGLLADLSGASRLSVAALDPVEAAPAAALAASAEATAPEAPSRVSATELSAVEPSNSPPPADHANGPWQRALDSLGWTIDANRWGELPDALRRVAPVRQVLASAGERRQATSKDGHTVLLCGFPDLRRPDSKVISIAAVPDLDGEDSFELLALHRYPALSGTCTPLGHLTPPADLLVGPVCVERTGRAPTTGGDLFAVEGRMVYLKRAGKVYSWDGRSETKMGTASQALATLVLRWSHR